MIFSGGGGGSGDGGADEGAHAPAADEHAAFAQQLHGAAGHAQVHAEQGGDVVGDEVAVAHG
jgi:hypothetical protein